MSPAIDPATEPVPDSLRRLLRWTICALLVCAPLPFGGVRPGSVLCVQLIAAASVVAGAALGHREGWTPFIPIRLPLLLCGLVLSIGLLQLVPLPLAWIDWLAPGTAAIRAETLAAAGIGRLAWEPLSLEPAATVDALLRLLAYVLIGMTTAIAFRHRTELRLAVFALGASGALQALYGSAQYLSGDQRILWVPKTYFLEEATGTFINKNHFAAYLVIALPFAVGLVHEGLRALPPATSWRERLVQLAERRAVSLPFGLLATGLIWLGVVLSYSRTGLVTASLVTAFLALRSADRRTRIAILLVLLLPIAWLLSQDIRGPEERFLQDDVTSIGGRLPVWRATAVAALESAALGSGFGTFEALFRVHRPASILQRWKHAHNDWLQSLVEGGPVTTAAFVVLLVVILRTGRGRRSPPPDDPWTRYCAVACGATALIAVVDFPLRIPAIAVTVAVVVGLRFGGSIVADARHG